MLDVMPITKRSTTYVLIFLRGPILPGKYVLSTSLVLKYTFYRMILCSQHFLRALYLTTFIYMETSNQLPLVFNTLVIEIENTISTVTEKCVDSKIGTWYSPDLL